MFLFQPQHIEMILRGGKTQTRRNHKRARARVGSIHQCRTELFGKPKAFIKIKRVWQQRLGDISAIEAIREGGYTREGYIKGLIDMHNGKLTVDSVVFCYEFELERDVT